MNSKEPTNGVKIYNVAGEKVFPEWMTQREKRDLAKKDEDYSNRIELLSSFSFPISSQRMEVTKDGKFLVVAGIYPPQIKVYELDQLSHHFTRNVDSEIVQFQLLADDYSKFAFISVDRAIEFHTKGGAYHKTRTPRVGRDMTYNENTTLMYVCGSSNEIYRLHLEQGIYYSPLKTESKSFNTAATNPYHSLLAFGSSEGVVHFFDPREPKELNNLDISHSIPTKSEVQVSSFRYNTDGLTFVAGTSTGHCAVYDLRMEKPLCIYDHKYGFPIKSIRFHSDDVIASADKKIIKIWNHKTGEMLTNIEPHAEINEICIVPRVSTNFSSSLKQNLNLFSSKNIDLTEEELEKEKKKNSGLILIAPENKENIGYFVPTLGPAPLWCSFLDNLTEELHNQKIGQTQYEDCKFLTRDELDRLALSDIIGTKLVRPFMHGFFISMKLYQKMKAVVDPFAWERYKKERIRSKIEEKSKSRIFRNPQNNPTKKNVNSQLAEAITEASDFSKKSWNDDRFTSDLFSNPNFEIDPNSTDFARVEKFNLMRDLKMKKKEKSDKKGGDIPGFNKLEEDEGDNDEEEDGGEDDEEDNSDDEDEKHMYEVDEDINQIAITPDRDEIFKEKVKVKKRLLGDRIDDKPVRRKKSSGVHSSNTITFTPQVEKDKLSKIKTEIKKRNERNKTRRKASFRNK